jgi:hypothetical protein
MVGASSTFYLGIFTFGYMIFTLKLNLFTDDLVYLLWTILFLVSITLMTGTISTIASGVFVNKLYN